MLNHQPFYWQHIRSYVTIIGTLLNDIAIIRQSNGSSKTIKVPVSFAQKDRQLQRLLTNPELRNAWKNYLPRITFEMGSPMYSPERQDNSNNLHMLDVNGIKRQMQYAPAAYDIPFTAYVHVPYFEDGLQIVEQILPFFKPEFNVKKTEVQELGISRDISVALVSVTQNDDYEGEFTEQRIMEWQLDFNLKGYFYGPIQETAVIKKVFVNFFDMDEDTLEPLVEYTATVDPFDADKEDEYIIIEETKERQ